MSVSVVILGAGGHARVVASGLLASGRKLAGCLAPLAPDQQWPASIPYLGPDERLEELSPQAYEVCIGVGSVAAGSLRQKLFGFAKSFGFRISDLVHPTAIVDPSAHLGEGVQLMAGAIVQQGAILGDNVIINTGAIVEHGCRIASHVHIATGALLCGEVDVGEGAHVGAGAILLQGRSVGAGATVGAGACVTRGVAVGDVVKGVPARRHARLKGDAE